MAFTLLPAIDVAGGRVARGEGSLDPVEVALGFQAEGASWIHVVDLDAAYGRGSNAEVLTAVIGALDVDVEVAGGIDDEASLARALATGGARVNLGTAALADPAWCARAIAEHGERVAVSLDVRAVGATHRLAARGGRGDGGDLADALAWLDDAACARYVVTDVDRDGELRGPNLDLCRTVAAATPARVVASGGIASIDDVLALAALASNAPNLEGAIVGRALHTARFTLRTALAALAVDT